MLASHLWLDGRGHPPRRHCDCNTPKNCVLVSDPTSRPSCQNNEERKQLIKTARRALDEAGLEDIGLLVGCGAPSTRATIKLVKEAAE